MKKKHVSRLISAALSLSMVCGLSTAALAAGPFADSAGTYGPAIEILQDNGLVNGVGGQSV